MPITALFRTILIAGLITTIIGAVAGMTLRDTLPPLLQEYLFQVQNEEMSYNATMMIFIALISVLILLIVSTIGLWKFKNWARVIYIIATVAFLPLYPALGPVVMNPWEAMFADIALILEGILIAMMFFSPIHEEFKLKS